MTVNPRAENDTEHYKEISDEISAGSVERFRITTEPLLVCAKLITILHRLWAAQYVFQVLSDENHLVTNGTSSLCDSHNSTTRELYAKVSSETSEWVLYLNLAGNETE